MTANPGNMSANDKLTMPTVSAGHNLHHIPDWVPTKEKNGKTSDAITENPIALANAKRNTEDRTARRPL